MRSWHRSDSSAMPTLTVGQLELVLEHRPRDLDRHALQRIAGELGVPRSAAGIDGSWLFAPGNSRRAAIHLK